jgi:hypothetical protein
MICVVGIVIFFNFSAYDFLTPGFVQKGIILENNEIKGDSSYVGIIHVDQTSTPYTLFYQTMDFQQTLMCELEILKRIYCMKLYSKKA